MMHWFAKISSAFALEVAALSMLSRQPSWQDLASYFALHAMASALVTWVAWANLPGKFKFPAGPACALLWVFAFFIPALGGMGILAVAHFARLFPRVLRTERFLAIRMPEFSDVQREATERSDLRAGDARRILKDIGLPLETRLRVLVAMQVMQPKAAIPLLLGLLSDPSEDIRLLAYSMMDAWEKDLVQKIQVAQQSLTSARKSELQTPLVNALRQLAELHWMQADTGLARGDLRRFTLEHARKFCEELLYIDASVQGIWQLYARVLIELGQLEDAQHAVQLARQQQMPAVEVWSLMGQIAYLRRDFAQVRACAAEIPDGILLSPVPASTANYWRQRRIYQVDAHV